MIHWLTKPKSAVVLFSTTVCTVVRFAPARALASCDGNTSAIAPVWGANAPQGCRVLKQRTLHSGLGLLVFSVH